MSDSPDSKVSRPGLSSKVLGLKFMQKQVEREKRRELEEGMSAFPFVAGDFILFLVDSFFLI